ncbi:polysaccharide export outer membrane protein [Halopseudomonas xinjiangensis]|uniref:Polysaccharide export outer membrane protein n=1 Tax=Halopseudomonas xinjiangensis TaxID=487184 RepID=A0A1H1NJW8_9GAMM|nr:polysaccharide biosynthesis/export family protein [Halopseudomonas xinjiangensis]SDR99294.1 polysaccharide export outer membrane protein [Halopseudomonas xinjiangensis]
MIRFPFAALGASLLLLQACAFAPGMHMQKKSLIDRDAADNSMVEIVQITPKVIAQEQAVNTRMHIPQVLLDYQPENYRIGANDALFITVWDHPELTVPGGPQQPAEANSRVVRSDGTLYYPFLGNVQVEGLELEQLRQLVADRLARVIEQPQVDVNVIGFNSQKIVVSGAFNTRGYLPITAEPLTLVQAVGMAGIDKARADLSNLTLVRDGVTYTLDYDRLTDRPSNIGEIYLRSGDKLHLALNDSRKIFVMGEVRTPRPLPYSTSRMTLSEVLATVGGPLQETASGREVYVIRGVEDLETQKATVFQLNASSPTAFILADQFEMQPQDVVFVGPAEITRWNRFISQLFPSANIFRTTLTIDEDLRDRSAN